MWGNTNHLVVRFKVYFVPFALPLCAITRTEQYAAEYRAAYALSHRSRSRRNQR